MSESASSVESVSSSLSSESADAASGVRWPAAAASAGWVRWLAQHERLTAAPPLAAALLLLVTIGAAFWYLSAEEARRETQAVRRELEFGQQHLRVRLHEQQAQLERLGREWAHVHAARPQAAQGFVQAARALAGRYSEILTIRWLDAQQRVRLTTAAGAPDAAHAAGAPQELAAQAGQEAADQAAFALAQRNLQPAYAVALALAQPGQGRALAEGDVPGDGPDGGMAADAAGGHAGLNVLHLYLPLLAQGRFAGALHVAYSADGLLRYGLPAGLQGKYAVALKDAKGRLLAGHAVQAQAGFDPGRWLWGQPPQQARLALAEHGPDLVLQAQAWRAAAGVGGRALFWTAAALSLMTLWMLGVNWHYLRQRQRAQAALLAEVGFRHAIENSMRTGMRAVDAQARITYVNRAFCEMTGWSEAELLGQAPPYSYWPQADREWLSEQLWRQMRGQIDAHGLSMRAQRKNGTIFDARIYLAPLVDSAGRQNGWVASMTDISEPNRVRRELSASHDRFAAVLDALDTAVSVAPLGSQELLFANRQYRQWFDATTQGHLSLLHNASLLRPAAARMDADAPAANEAAAAEPASAPAARAEIFLPEQNRWLEVRSRYLSWVDGRLAQMVIATDITARRQAEQRAQEQAQRAEDASRLITMGEMASSVAHELNQPLTAISNYCTGIISRLREGGMDEAALLGALEKVARQAQRAGMVIQHIRNFVKRSEPRMQATSAAAIAEPVLELAEVEARRRRVQLSSEIAPDLPALRADPILIGQVLLNLIRNSAEAIDTAQRPAGQRRITLQASLIQIEDMPAVQFAVQDSGCGLPPGVQERLYEAFFSTKHDGMGIGLNLCRSIIEAHQGRMHVANIYNLGQVAGCRLSFWIPVTLAPDDQHAAGLAPAALSGANRTPPRPPFSEPDPT